VSRFSRCAWAVFLWNCLVILWGAFVRASHSGAGCGSHWPLCNGAFVPPSPSAETIIEFTHRATSGLALLGVVALVVWSRRRFPKRHPARTAAVSALVLILVEALLGAGLVLLNYVVTNASAGRAVYLSAHMTNTLLLLAALAATAWLGAPAAPPFAWARVPRLIRGALAAALVLSVTGVIAALGDTIYPATSLATGLRQDFLGASPALLRLRLLHPVVAGLGGLYLVGVAVVLLQRHGRAGARWLAVATVVQLSAGTVNILLLAPVWMQIVHLALALAVWTPLLVATFEVGSASLHVEQA
jgi:cytochrome c oxidase assembly protein subunit 15/protoheme IX farnesyltransferase